MIDWLFPKRDRWLYTLEHDFVWPSGRDFGNDWSCKDQSGTERLVLRKNGDIIVKANYTWDGCTPKYSVMDFFLMGTPEGVVNPKTMKCKTYYASLTHDALYQFMPEFKAAGVPMSYRLANRVFFELLRDADFLMAKLYFWAVELFGEGYSKGTRAARRQNGTVVPFNP